MSAAPASRVKVEPVRTADGGHVRLDGRDEAFAGLAAPSAAPLVPATAALVPPVVARVAPPLVPVLRPAEGDDDDRPEPEVEVDRGAAMVSGTGASAPSPPAGVGPRLQRSSLPELWKAMTTQDKDEDGGWLVDDATEKLTDGQMRKADFMKQLREEVHRVADEQLSAIGRSSAACPYLDEMLHRYDRRTAAEVERAVRRYAPEARGVDDARDYIPRVAQRIARGIQKWIETRKIPDDLPSDEVQSLASAGGWVGAAAGLAGIAPPKEDNDKADQPPQRKALGPSVGRVDGRALVAQLGPGRPLDGGVRGRMERALGHSFAAVRIHADDRAAGLNRDLAARAFTIGPHVALGAGAPPPGTIEGDALLAHELAHVVQQGTAAPAGDVPVGAAGDALEHDADQAAARAIGVLHGERDPDRDRTPRGATARGGLRLQRCTPAPAKPPVAVTPARDPIYDVYDQALAQLKTTAPEVQQYLANVPLGGVGFLPVRVASQTLQGGPAIEHRFQLRVELRDRIEGGTTLARFVGPGPRPTDESPGMTRNLGAQPPNIVYPMIMQVSRAASANLDDLTANLFHEGTHLLLYMDQRIREIADRLKVEVDPLNMSAAQAPFQQYVAAARGLREFDSVASLFAHAAVGGADVTPDDTKAGENEVITNVLNEKFAYDTTGARFNPRYRNSNHEIAIQYVPDIIAANRWVVTPAQHKAMVDAVETFLDKLDVALHPPAADDHGARRSPSLSAAPAMIQRTSLFEAVVMVTGLEVDRGGGLIVDDSARKLATGQMRKREFFPLMRAAVRRTADVELARAGRSADGCPYLEKWLAHYEGQSAAHLEKAIRRYAPQAQAATRAHDYLEPLSAKLAEGIARWAKTGEIPGAPDELAAGGEATPRGLHPKMHGGAEGPTGLDVGAVAARLGPGQPLPASVRGPMERALDFDFAHVRIHTDGGAARLSQDLAARAFAVGSHVAFGADEFRPGDPRSDALVAHELAHVAQQHGGSDGGGSVDAPGALEAEADDAAAAAVAAIHGTERDVARYPRRRPSRGRGLQLSRCDAHTPLARSTEKRGAPPGWNNRPSMKEPLKDAVTELWQSEIEVDHNTAANLSWGYPAVYGSHELRATHDAFDSSKLDGNVEVQDANEGWAAGLDRRFTPPPVRGGKIDRELDGENPIMLIDKELLVPAEKAGLKSVLVHEMSHATYTPKQKAAVGDDILSHYETEFVARWVEPRNRELSDNDKADKAKLEIVGPSANAGTRPDYKDIHRAYWGNLNGLKAKIDAYRSPRNGLNLTNEMPPPAEDWNFTPADYGAMKRLGVNLRFSEDSNWFPFTFKASLLKSLEALLDPARTEAPTTGVSPRDLFHGHIGIKRERMTKDLAGKVKADSDASYKAYAGALGTFDSGLLQPVTDKTLPAFKGAVEQTEASATALLRAVAEVPDVVVVFHSYENNKPADMPYGSKRRGFLGPAGKVAEPYEAPKAESADSWEQGPEEWTKGEAGTAADAPYIAIYQFSFLIDNRGVIHVRPWAHAISSKVAAELSTITGKKP